VFREPGGRRRLGWRLVLYVGLATVLAGVGRALLPGGLAGGSAAVLVAAWLAGAILLATDGRAPGALGLYLARPARREAVCGVALGVGLAGGVGLILLLGGAVRFGAEGGTLAAWAKVGAGSLALLALPAAAEEVLVRGYPLQAMAEVWGAGVALVVTSVGFGALHLPNPGASWIGVANTAAAGLLLGALVLRTGSLWWATGAHLGWNWALGFLLDLPVSGLDVVDAPLLRASTRGPEWWSGGAFGPEGSVAAAAVLLAAAAVVWAGPWPRASGAARAAGSLAADALRMGRARPVEGEKGDEHSRPEGREREERP